MSYDVSIGDADFNCTYNVSKLFYDHIPQVRDRGGLSEVHGLSGKQAASILGDAFERIHGTYLTAWRNGEVGAATFRAKYDPPNGWGSTVGGLIFLARLMAACTDNPRKKVEVS